MHEKKIDLYSPQEDAAKAIAIDFAFAAQAIANGRIERFISAIPLANELFVRVRDVLVSEHLKAVYFPVPKSACTLLATALALFDPACRDFDPNYEGIHRYRFRRKALRPNDLRCLDDDSYFRFTVVRNPVDRIVSGYVDKFVKPLFLYPDLRTKQIFNWTFKDLLDYVSRHRDSKINKHWRPQYRFFQNTPIDYIGAFEHMKIIERRILEELGIDLKNNVSSKVYEKARTSYSRASNNVRTRKPIYEMTPYEFYELGRIPLTHEFLSEDMSEIICKRYRLDAKIHRYATAEAEAWEAKILND